MHRFPDARLTCVTDFLHATYSGMLPGVLSGQYVLEQMQIDLVRLSASCGVSLIRSETAGIDPVAQRIMFHGRPSLPYDALVIGVGSAPRLDQAQRGPGAVPIKPMQTLLTRLACRLKEIQGRPRPWRVCIVGGGVGGVEIVFCLPAALQRLGGVTRDQLQLSLVHAGDALPVGVTPATQRRVQRELARRGVDVHRGRKAVRVTDHEVWLDDGQSLPADLVIWSGGAAAPPVLESLPFAKDERGFLLIRPTLQLVDQDRVFAVGDSGTLANDPFPKAGVYAVRQGPPLWRNLQRVLAGEPLEEYRPQRKFLKLINTGDGKAIGEYKGWTFHTRWAWRLKDGIDRAFMGKYQKYEPPGMMSQPPTGPADAAAPPMRCVGCGGKVGGSVLARALARLEVPRHPRVALGLQEPDDAAVIRVAPDHDLLATVDFFSSPVDDPFLAGRLAALNAVSDVLAKGGRGVAALAMAGVPHGDPLQQEQLLYELLAGILQELEPLDTALAGGHTIESPALLVGLTVLADEATPRHRKSHLRPGDQLVLTKPLGTGVLLAAHMRAACKAAWYQAMLDSMLTSNAAAAAVAAQCHASAITDVTGFGLAGHLLEMLRASACDGHVELGRMPLLPGAIELSQQGVQSTLVPANRDNEAWMEAAETVRCKPEFELLFDPQTSGGLLIGVSAEGAEALLRALRAAGMCQAAVIGQAARATAQPRLHVSQARSASE